MPNRAPVPPEQRVKRKRGRAGVAQRLRRLKRSNGLCEHCLERGITRAAVVVNHKVPLAFGGSDLDENTENLCRECDDRVTAEQFGRVNPAERGVDASGRPILRDHPWNSSAKAEQEGAGVETSGPKRRTPTPTLPAH